MKKLATLAACAALFGALALPAMAEEGLVKVGGHMKGPVLTDNVKGKYMVDGVKGEGSYSAGTYFASHAFILYVSKDINENLSVEASPDFGNGGAGATPSLGKKLGSGTLKDTGASPTIKFNALTVSMNFPQYGVQARAGYFSLPFIQDYGKELFWHEEFNGGKFTLANAWHDAGLELYKPFEIGSFSLPVSVYLVNGNSSSNRDNNNSRAVMAHVEPQFGPVKTFASYGYGKWGDSVALSTGGVPTTDNGTFFDTEKTFQRWSAGAEYAYKAFKVRGEAAGSVYEKNILYNNTMFGNKDSFGYYGKLFYTIKPEKLTAMLHYNYYWTDVQNGLKNGLVQEKYDTTYVGVQYEIAPAATFIAGYMTGNWRNNDIASKRDYVRFQRIETGLRVTF